jgi:serine/threonine protein kinase
MIYNVLLEFASGGSLANLIKKSSGHGLSESDVRKHTKSMLVGLKHIHACGRSEFIFVNPNSKGQCRCGESFMMTSNSPAAKLRTG